MAKNTNPKATRTAWLIIATGLVGCVNESRPGLAPVGDSERTVAVTEPENPKTRLSLNEIEPQPDVPRTPSDLPPLSDRSQRQISKANAVLAERRFTEAAIELERALRYDPNHPSIHAVLAVLHWRAGNTERARSHAERAVEGNPDQAAPLPR